MGHAFDDELANIFPGMSEMARVMKEHDWEGTPMREPRDWPDALKIPLRMLLTSRFEMWLGWGPELQFFYNDAYIPTLGIKHPEMLGRPFREVWSEVYADVADQVKRVQAGEATWNKAMLLLLERSGYPEETYHSFSYSPLFGSDGAVCGLLCIVSEETARIINERRLETLRRLGAALAGAKDKAAIHQAARSVFATNRRDFPFAVLKFAGEEPGGDDQGILEQVRAILPTDLGQAEEIIALPSDTDWPMGDWDRPATSAIAIAIPGPTGEPHAGTLVLGLNPYRPEDPEILHVAQLIAGQIGGALAGIATLQAERRRADRIWSVSRDLIVVVDADGLFRSVSPSWTRILGDPVDEVVGRPFADFMHPDDIPGSNDALARAVGGQELNDYENRFRSADGSYRRIEWHTTLENGLVYAYGRDVTERRRVEEALSDSEEQFRHLVQGVTDYAIYMLDLEGHVSSWNEGARRIKGYEPDEIIGEHFSRFYTDEDRARGEPDRALETARREGRFLAEGWRVRKDGERFRASVVIDAIRNDEGRPIGFAKITRDITEKEEAQRQLETARETLFQSQKMDAIGQLTGGVAHDFNNLLMAVLSSLELLGKRLPDDPLSRRLLSNATEGAKRGATLTQRMLAFARRQELNVDTVDLPQLLSGMNDLVQRSIGPEWPISTNFPLKLPAVRADANQLEMALLNLIVNARDATPGGGPILISATCEDLPAGPGTKLSAGAYVRLVVKDQGSGMDAETLRRATEPFYTTKGVGKGTGLGLPMVHGLAQQIGGSFELLSEIGAGTSAVLWLPVAPQEAGGSESVVVEMDTPSVPRLRILAVDDDALVLINTVALLEDLGHEVVEADTAEEALELFRQREDIDLLVTDQAMPNMTGTDLITAVDALRPGIPAIIASGYGEGVSAGREVVRLGKPFNQGQLARAIAEAVEPDAVPQDRTVGT
ncbi:PAS domain S-box protein [Sphingomonas oryzagri]|jgi:PAS domain S-box-containing protein|uniref:histidine kinase n=1 Tax=Sphingomonas oryzagri TaxID=3042314 RepID=A0ABT6MYU7_9SPHN|nr:PAS domain S-box protein [Sphingomonas oryzagri]MDH7638230.1 PAS domain S-box protein [Sphingomonas oryzagri]